MLLVEQGSDDGIQTNRLTLTGGTGNEQVRNLGQIHHEHLVGDGFTQCDRQFHLGFLEFLRVQNALHAHDVRLGVRYLDTDGSLAWDRGDDTYTQCCEAQGDVILQVLDLRDAHALGRLNLIEGDGRSHRSSDGLNLHAEVVEHFDDAVLVCLLLFLVDGNLLVVILLQQVEGRVLVFGERLLRVDRRIEHLGVAHRVAGSLLFAQCHGDVHAHMLRSGSGSFHLHSFSFRFLGTLLSFHLQEARCSAWSGGCYRLCRGDSGIGYAAFRFILILVGIEIHHLRLLLLAVLLRRSFLFCIFLFRLFLLWSLLFLFLHIPSSFSVLVSQVYVFRVRISMVGDFELHLIRYISDRVECLSHDGDGLCGEIGEEGYSHEEEDGCESGRTYHVLQVLHHIESVLAARVEDKAAHQRGEELGEGDARPYHDNHHAEKPFPQVDVIYMHQLESCHHHETWKQEGWESEVHCHQPVGDDGTQRTAVVLKLLFGVGPFAWSQVF